MKLAKICLAVICLVAVAGCGKPVASSWEYKSVMADDDEQFSNTQDIGRLSGQAGNDAKISRRLDENKTVHGKFTHVQDQIAELGSNRWELVSAEYIPIEHPAMLLLFKRPLR